jgi:hypothetical protein
MVAILSAAFMDALPAVEAAYAQATFEGVHSSDVIIKILAQERDPGATAAILTPDALTACSSTSDGSCDTTGSRVTALVAASATSTREATVLTRSRATSIGDTPGVRFAWRSSAFARSSTAADACRG